jgi:hypothetical protein
VLGTEALAGSRKSNSSTGSASTAKVSLATSAIS